MSCKSEITLYKTSFLLCKYNYCIYCFFISNQSITKTCKTAATIKISDILGIESVTITHSASDHIRVDIEANKCIFFHHMQENTIPTIALMGIA